MFRKKKSELDVDGLNELIHSGRGIFKIVYIMAIIALVLLCTYLIKEWSILKVIGEFLAVISPIFIGVLIAWLLDPLVKWLQGKRVPRIVGCILVYIVFIGGLFLILALVLPTFIDQVKDFVGTIPDILKDLKHFTNDLVSNLSHTFDYDLTDLKNQIYQSIEGFGIGLTTKVPNMILGFLTAVFSGGMTVVLGLMIGFYMLFDFDKMNRAFISVLPKHWKMNAAELIVRLNDSLRGYVQGVLLVMCLVFVTQSIGLTLSGIKAPLVFALFCAITDIIPYFGPYIGAIPAVIVGFTMDPVVGVCCLISIFVVQLLENNFYQPLIMGHTMKLHPVTIMVGLLIFQHFFGIIGMIVATPVIAALKVVLTFINEKFKMTDRVVEQEV